MESGNEKYITTWSPENEVLTSEYGTTTYRAWCEREVKRINNSGGACKMAFASGKRLGIECCVIRV